MVAALFVVVIPVLGGESEEDPRRPSGQTVGSTTSPVAPPAIAGDPYIPSVPPDESVGEFYTPSVTPDSSIGEPYTPSAPHPEEEPLPEVNGDPETFLDASYDHEPFTDYITQNDCYRAEPGIYIKCDTTGVSFLMEGGHVKAVFGANE